MSDYLKKELSKKNKYYLEPGRREELKWFCRQYFSWQRQINELEAKRVNLYSRSAVMTNREAYYKPDIFTMVDARSLKVLSLWNRVKMVDEAVAETSSVFSTYLKYAVTHDITSYEKMVLKFPDLPCGKNYWYQEVLRKFFWILDKKRD